MSQLFQTLKNQVLAARKRGDKVTAGVGLVIIGDIETETKRSGKAVTDDQVIARAKKLIDSNQEVIEGTTEESKLAVLKQENEFLGTLLPKQLSEDDLRAIIAESGLDQIGAIMGYLKKNHGGQFDGKVASKLVKEHLSQ